MFKKLETERLTLESIRLEDAKILYEEIFNDFEYYKFYFQLPYKTFEDFFRTIQKYQEYYEEGNHFIWGIRLKNNKKIIGIVLLHGKDKLNNSCKIGYIISKQEQNKGYITEAIKSVISFCFEVLEIHRIEANVLPNNLKSIKILEKIGFHYEGLKKECYKINDEYFDEKSYALIKK